MTGNDESVYKKNTNVLFNNKSAAKLYIRK